VYSVGVRKLKEQTSRILRLVQEQGTDVEITHRGKVIARLIPVSAPQPSTGMAEVWSDLDQLAEAIGAHWPVGDSAEDAVREQRREL
jgi:prevent-host-death family protein